MGTRFVEPVGSARMTLIEAGLSTRLVDMGRPNTRSLGLALGGPADRWAYTLGNALLRNPLGCAALEISLRGPTIRVDQPVACVVFGAPFVLESDRAQRFSGRTFTLEPGETLRIGGTPHGARAYLGVGGGFFAPEILGSRSGLSPLTSGVELSCGRGEIPGRSPNLPTSHSTYFRHLTGQLSVIPLRALPGPQADWFERTEFFGPQRVYTVTPSGNRMGLRLIGEPLSVPARELVSEPVAPGAVQVTRDGQTIVLGVDGQTIGGYPKIAHVIGADLDLVGQLRPGDRVTFEQIGMGQAEEASRQRRATLREWVMRFTISELFAVPGSVPVQAIPLGKGE